MPLRRSARHQSQTSTVPINTITPEQSRLLTTQNDHASRFLSLPTEILQEIVNHVPAGTMTCNRLRWPLSSEDEFVQRRGRVIRILCAVSRVLHQTFWARMWRDIEMLTSRYASEEVPCNHVGRWETDMTERISLLIDVASENPALANQVETLNILIGSPSYNKSVLPKIAKMLSLFPNVNSVQLHTNDRTSSDVHKRLCKPFLGRQFPSIKKLALVAEQITIAGCCPNLQELHILSYILHYNWWLEPHFPAKSIQFLCVNAGIDRIKDAVDAMPNIKTLEFHDAYLSQLRFACSDLLSLKSQSGLTRFKVSLSKYIIYRQQEVEELLSRLPPQIQYEVCLTENQF